MGKTESLKTLDIFSIGKEIQLINCHCLNDNWLITLGKRHPQCFTLDHCHDEAQRVTAVGLKQFFQQCEGSLKVMSYFRRNVITPVTLCFSLQCLSANGCKLTDDSVAMLIEDHGKR
ncbi:hypothetical protein JD844_009121 [Phrynosoma platyrhinos]|uniref:Uncharacterized protein n=1 Tax=Phrynosoma platyrhinos TaxID=52577 RepID=A0ABQ7TGE7_PHRPL|nr:hypothetical protein JD844_009121 [Phrynosoma platyrhinos]